LRLLAAAAGGGGGAVRCARGEGFSNGKAGDPLGVGKKAQPMGARLGSREKARPTNPLLLWWPHL